MQNDQLDRTQETEAEYVRRAINLSIKAYKEAVSAGHDISSVSSKVTKGGTEFDAITIIGVAQWASAKWVKNLSPRTWRTYRAAINFYADSLLMKGEINSSQRDKVTTLLANKSHLNEREIKRTSARKAKHIKGEDLEALISHLVKLKAKNAKPLANWLYANVLVGLRPVEWRTVSVIEIGKQPALLVQNAKNTNNRAHGDTRVIKLKSFTAKQQKGIVSFAMHCRKLNDSDSFDAFYNDCRKVLLRANKKLWPRRKKGLTLYSTRHQFSADLKKSGRTLIEIAYLMGHASTETATHHYGKRRYGKDRRTPEVDVAMAQKVKRKPVRFSFSNKSKLKV